MSLTHKYADLSLETKLLALLDSSMDTALEQTAEFPTVEAKTVKRLAKSGLKSETFAREALDLGRLHEGLLPRGLDLERFERTIVNRDAIRARLRKAQKLVERLQVLSVLLGVDTYSDALDVYHSLKRHGTDQSLQTSVKELGRIFKRGKREVEEVPEPVVTGTTAPVTVTHVPAPQTVAQNEPSAAPPAEGTAGANKPATTGSSAAVLTLYKSAGDVAAFNQPAGTIEGKAGGGDSAQRSDAF